MDEQDGAISGPRDATTAETGPHGDLEDASSQHRQEGMGYRADPADSSPTAGTVLPGEEKSTHALSLDMAGGEGDKDAVGANEALDIAAGQAPDGTKD